MRLPALIGIMLTTGTLTASAQPSVDVSSTAFIDYLYVVDEPSGELQGDNGFTFRRLYLTIDFDISEDFSARARLEAGDGLASSKGATPFVKGLFDVVSSRDMGVRADGPLVGDGTVRYAVMVGNNEGTRPEDDCYKRVYGQLRFFPTGSLTFTLGADYAGYDDPRDSGLALNGFAGYETETFAAGAEGVWNRIDYDAAGDEEVTTGVSLFARARVVRRGSLRPGVRRDADRGSLLELRHGRRHLPAGPAGAVHSQPRVRLAGRGRHAWPHRPRHTGTGHLVRDV